MIVLPRHCEEAKPARQSRVGVNRPRLLRSARNDDLKKVA